MNYRPGLLTLLTVRLLPHRPEGRVIGEGIHPAVPGQAETELATGKNAKIITTANGDYVVFQRDGRVWTITPDQPQPTAISAGSYPKLTLLPNDRVLCLWEQGGVVRADLIR